MTFRVLDTYCKAGGAGAGYERALRRLYGDVEVTGVDIAAQPRYPFRFLKADAVAYIREHGHEYDFIHSSPPCQRYTAGRRALRLAGNDPHPDLIEATREALQASGVPYAIENVPGSPLRNYVVLCGQMFPETQRIYRHRWFETSFPVLAPGHPKHSRSMLDGSLIAVYGGKWLVSGGARKGEDSYHTYGRIPLEFRTVEAKAAAMGISWMSGRELEEAIPPAFTEFLGQFIPLPVTAERAA